jgi:hypothetical protein
MNKIANFFWTADPVAQLQYEYDKAVDQMKEGRDWPGWMRRSLRACRGASSPRSRPDVSRRLEPALKPLFSRAVRTVAWNAVRGCGCRSRAARRVTPEKSPGRKWTCTSSPQSVGGPRAGEIGGGSSGSPKCVRIFRIGPGSVMKAMSRMSPPHAGHWSGNSSPTRAISVAQVIREVSWERGFAWVPQQAAEP